MSEHWDALCSYAVTGAALYHEYLEAEGKGFAETRVEHFQRIGSEDVLLLLSGRLSSSDGIFIRIYNHNYTNDEILPIHYDRKKRTLLIRLRKDMWDKLDGISPKNVLVVADLKFLVLRIKEWYEKCEDSIHLPRVRPAFDLSWPELTDTPSPEQEEAIQGIFSNPLSYIWGAPGTGKTRFVLARAVLAYCLREEPVLIVAPTNNAVEQTLYGVLSVLKEAGVPLDKVIRLGVPSQAFYQQYPEVCESLSAEDERKNTQKDLDYYQRSLSYIRTSVWYSEVQPAVQAALEAEKLFRQEREKIDLANQQDKNACQAIHAKCAPLLSRIEELSVRRKHLSAYLNKPRNRITSLIIKQRLMNTRIERDSIDTELHVLGEEYERLIAVTEEKTQQIEKRETRKVALREARDASIAHLETLQPCPISSDFDSIVHSLSRAASVYLEIQKAASALEAIESRLKERTAQYEGITEESAEAAILNLKKRMQSLEKQTVTARLENCLVAAVTADGFVGRSSAIKAYLPHHVFLDEAAYCPLIKCIPLLCLGVPLTLLGDHKQLSPVCEAPPKFMNKPENNSVSLWAQSALFLEDAFSLPPNELSYRYLTGDEPRFIDLHRYPLTTSFRFGQLLARVLDSNVYHIGLEGNPKVGTFVYYISVPKRKLSNGKRENMPEASAVLDLVSKIQSDDLAVLTPFRAQRDLLIKMGLSPEFVSTVHGAQGREWDTVILSVVETTRSEFLTPILMNTAVSRARKRLVLVCDTNYWKGRYDHLIGELLSCASPFEE